MTNSEQIVSETIRKINSSIISFEKAFWDNYYIARTGVYGSYPGLRKKYFIGGFSCKKNLSEAKAVASFETAERVLATYNLSLPERRDKCYPLYSIDSAKPLRYVKADYVLIGPTSGNPINCNDAVGLGFHNDKNEAIKHAVFELIERNLLGKIWYENHPLIKLSESILDDFICSNFTIKHSTNLPFIMSILHDKNCNFLCVGAAYSDSLQSAHEKSKAEAIMLANDVLYNKIYDHVENINSRVRMQSQSIPSLSQKRKKYVSLLTNTQINDERYDVKLNLEQSLDALNITNEDIGYCCLHESTHYHLYRAVSKKILTLGNYRKMFVGTEKYFIDPIC